MAERLNWEAEAVEAAMEALPDAASLDLPVSTHDSSLRLGEFVEDEWPTDTFDAVILEMDKARLEKAIERLPQRARYVLIRRYGLDDRDPATLAELGGELEITRERVRQLQLKALKTLEKRIAYPSPA